MSQKIEALNNQINGTYEKTYIDKLLAKDDIGYIKQIIKKENPTKQDILDLLNSLASPELKLVNFDKWTWYVTNKIYIWIREFVKIAESLYDYEEKLNTKEITKKTKLVFKENKRIIVNAVKFLADLYMHLTRSTLSIGAAAFKDLNSNKFEYVYPTNPVESNNNEKKNIFRR